jgi:hypothetical protein
MKKKSKRINKNPCHLNDPNVSSNYKNAVRKKINSNLSDKALINIRKENGKIIINRKERV